MAPPEFAYGRSGLHVRELRAGLGPAPPEQTVGARPSAAPAPRPLL